MEAGADVPLAKADCYKKTAIGGYVIKRHCRLFPNHFTTYRDEALDPEESREYTLGAGARLFPSDPDEMPKLTRRVRPEGVGHLTALAAAAGKGREIELHSFKLEYDHGHQFHFGFETLEAAKDFHQAVARQLLKLYGPPGAPEGGADSRAGAPAAGRDGAQPQLLTVDSGAMIPGGMLQLRTTSDQDEGASDDEGGELSALWHFAPGTTTSSAFGKRWVPYRHTNGIAIYKHSGRGGSGGGGGLHRPEGDEYMVSAVVRGKPIEALRVLMDPGSSTTILGPAREVEVMESSHGEQVLRIQVQAGGVIGSRLAPREAVVRRMLRRECPGIYVLLFGPYSGGEEAFEGQGVVEEVEGLDDGGRSRWSRPVRCRVGGGFTISRLAGALGAKDSPECLVTLVLNVQDLGGWLSSNSLMRKLLEPTGAPSAATEALVERMLMSVMLVRDTVEQKRFAVHPGLMRATQQGAAQHQDAAGKALLEDELQRSATLVMRRAATQFEHSHAGSGRAAAAAAASAAAGGAGGIARLSRLASSRVSALPGLPGEEAGGLGAEEAPGEPGEEEEQPPCNLDSSFYEELHTPGHDTPFKVRGPHYLQDGQKVVAGLPMFELVGVELFETQGVVQHISRYIPAIRRSPKPFLFCYHLSVPGPPTLSLVFVYATDSHPDTLGAPPEDPDEGDWQPFDWLMYRFLKGTDSDRSSMFKMIPHIAEGSWVIRSAVGTTPVIVARKLATKFYITDKYIEVCVDVGSNSTANYVTGMVRGATRSLVVDLALLLEGQHSYELPEVLVGACRLQRLDLSRAAPLDTSQGEVPLRLPHGKRAPAKQAEEGEKQEDTVELPVERAQDGDSDAATQDG